MRADQSDHDPFADVRWIPAAENPYGVDLIDCRSITQSWISTSGDPEIAQRYVSLRESSGEQHRQHRVENGRAVACDLRYPHRGETRDGPLFLSGVMEEKWDIFLYDGFLYFARSWNGDLMFRATIVFGDGEARVTEVEAPEDLIEPDPSYVLSYVDYLIRSHLLGLPLPHPLPREVPNDPRALALFSLSHFGRFALYGTYADTTRLQVPEGGWDGSSPRTPSSS